MLFKCLLLNFKTKMHLSISLCRNYDKAILSRFIIFLMTAKEKRGQSAIHYIYLHNHGTLDLLISFVLQLIFHQNTGKQCLLNERMLSLLSLSSLQSCSYSGFPRFHYCNSFSPITAQYFSLKINATLPPKQKKKKLVNIQTLVIVYNRGFL